MCACVYARILCTVTRPTRVFTYAPTHPFLVGLHRSTHREYTRPYLQSVEKSVTIVPHARYNEFVVVQAFVHTGRDDFDGGIPFGQNA